MRAIIHTVKRDGPVKKRVAYLANKSVLIGDWVGNDVTFNSERLMEGHHGKGRKTRHIILSLEQGGDLPDTLFATAAERFMATFAPQSAWLGAVDRNTKSVHLHLLLCNSDGERTLNLSPSVLSKMQEVESWTGGILETGKRGAILAKLTTAAQIKSMSYEQIRTELERGNLAVGRRNKFGDITSVVLGGRRVRLSTVQRVASLSDAQGNATNREPGNPKMGVVGHLDDKRQHGSPEARRRTYRNYRTREMGAANAHSRKEGTSRTPLRREPPSLLFTHPRPVQGDCSPHGTSPLDSHPSMGGRAL